MVAMNIERVLVGKFEVARRKYYNAIKKVSWCKGCCEVNQLNGYRKQLPPYQGHRALKKQVE